DDGILPDVQIPRASDVDDDPARELHAAEKEILRHPAIVAEGPTPGEATRLHPIDVRKTEDPERGVDQVHAQVHQASPAGKRRIVEPRLVRTVAVVKGQRRRIDAPDLAGRYRLLDAAYGARTAIRKVHAEQSVRRPRL